MRSSHFAVIASAVALAMPAAAAAQARGRVTAVRATANPDSAVVQFLVTGRNPCGAVTLDYGNGAAVTHAIERLPVTLRYSYSERGDYRIVARGEGNCDGESATTVRVDGAAPRRTDRPTPEDRMRFAGMDANGDGIITRAEWRGSARAFEGHDRNRDGVLSGDEVRPGGAADPVPDVVDRDATDLERARSEFRAIDRDGNGRITLNEWQLGFDAFRRADENRDNVLSLDEWLSRSALDDTPRDSRDLFDSLDVDRNGIVSRSEWHWSLQSFEARDLNRDGRLSREEVDYGNGVTDAVDAEHIEVRASDRWTDTGVIVRAGDRIIVEANGVVRLSRSNESDVATPAGSKTGRLAGEAPMSTVPAGALIGRIGNGAPFLIGSSRAPIRVERAGRLSLGVNDDYLADNTGSFLVAIRVVR